MRRHRWHRWRFDNVGQISAGVYMKLRLGARRDHRSLDLSPAALAIRQQPEAQLLVLLRSPLSEMSADPQLLLKLLLFAFVFAA